jgi:SRP54-type protein, GTPase domain
VEQLRVHARCLDVPLFEMGYAKDPSQVAAAALKHARERKHTCVLIDTAVSAGATYTIYFFSALSVFLCTICFSTCSLRAAACERAPAHLCVH